MSRKSGPGAHFAVKCALPENAGPRSNGPRLGPHCAYRVKSDPVDRVSRQSGSRLSPPQCKSGQNHGQIKSHQWKRGQIRRVPGPHSGNAVKPRRAPGPHSANTVKSDLYHGSVKTTAPSGPLLSPHESVLARPRSREEDHQTLRGQRNYGF